MLKSGSRRGTLHSSPVQPCSPSAVCLANGRPKDLLSRSAREYSCSTCRHWNLWHSQTDFGDFGFRTTKQVAEKVEAGTKLGNRDAQAELLRQKHARTRRTPRCGFQLCECRKTDRGGPSPAAHPCDDGWGAAAAVERVRPAVRGGRGALGRAREAVAGVF